MPIAAPPTSYDTEHALARDTAPDGAASLAARLTGGRAPTPELAGALAELGELVESERRLREELREAERRAAELRVVGEHYRRLVETSPHGVFVIGRDGRFVEVNQALARRLGRPAERLIGLPVATVIAPDDRAMVARMLAERLEGRLDPRDFELEVLLPGGERRQGCVAATAATDAAGRVIGSLGAVCDVTEERAQRVALQQSEEKHRLLFETLGQGVVYQDATGRILDANPSAQRILGLTLEQLRARTAGDAAWSIVREDGSPFPIDDFPTVVALRTGREVRSTVMGVFNPALGEYRWLHVSAIPLFHDGEARPHQVHTTFEDFTARRHVDEVLRTTTHQLETLLYTLPDAAWLKDRDGRYLAVNDAFARRCGRERAEILGAVDLDLFPPELAAGFQAADARVRHTGERDTSDDAYTNLDGTQRSFETVRAPVLDADGVVESVVGIARDVTERRRREERIHFQASLLEAVGQAVIATDRDGLILYWNAAAEKLYGWTAAEASGQSILELIPTGNAWTTTSDVISRLRAGESWTGEFHTLRRDGGPFVAQTALSPVCDSRGTLTGIIGISYDLTGRKQLEDQLRQAQKMEAVGRLAGGVAHDFNNMLTAISGYSTLMELEVEPGSTAHEYLVEIQNAARRSATLTRQLLAFSRRQILKPQRIDLNESVRGVEKMLRRLIGEDVELVTDLARGTGLVEADPGQMEQVLLNLAVNARDAMPQGGRLRISTHAETWATASDAGRACVVLSVADDGAGMDEATLAHIFEPFFTTKEVGRGTGLGLATVHGIVVQTGGSIEVESTPGMGTTFHVRIPAAGREDPVESLQAQPVGAPAPGCETVLVVEDEAPVRTLAVRILQRAGYHVLSARNGADALEVSARFTPPIHLLLTDVVMPGMSGQDLAGALRLGRPALPVLFMSGYTDDATVRYGIVHQQCELLDKPFRPDALLERVRAVLDAR